MYLIIVGAGDIGGPLIDLAVESGEEVVVIERDAERADDVASQHDCLVLNVDATHKTTIEDAGADRADVIITTTNQDATNVMVCLLANDLGIPTTVSVVRNPEHMSLFRQIGVTTMENPQQLFAEYLYRSVARPAIQDYMRIGDEAEVFEITVGEDAPIAGHTLREVGAEGILPDDALVVAIEREGQASPITPRGNTRIEPRDLLTVYSESGATPDLTDVFGHYEDSAE